jgi:hypothetical protein
MPFNDINCEFQLLFTVYGFKLHDLRAVHGSLSTSDESLKNAYNLKSEDRVEY